MSLNSVKVTIDGICGRERERERSAYKVLIGKSEGMRLHERPKRRWENAIKMFVKEIMWQGVHWIRQAQVKK
jgi:hypothetical protein